MSVRQPRGADLSPEAKHAYAFLAGQCADRAVEVVVARASKALSEPLADLADMKEKLGDPETCIRIFLRTYAFARRGKDGSALSHSAIDAMDSVEGYPKDGVAVWEAFVAKVAEHRLKPSENQNRGPIQGMIELSEEVAPLSIAQWVATMARREGGLTEAFERVVDIRGLGPKCASHFLRDVVLAFDVEDGLHHQDQICIQTIDRWLRKAAEIMVPEPGMDKAADWIIAGKMSKYCRRAGVSGIRFSLGVQWFGHRVAGDPDRFAAGLADAILNGGKLPDQDARDAEPAAAE